MRGRLRTITGTNPAASVEIVEAVPAGKRWRVIAFTFKLTTGATAGGRFSTLVIDDGATIFAICGSMHSQVPSITEIYSYSIGAARGQISGSVVAFGSANAWGDALPDATLAAGYRIRTSTFFADAADNYTAPQYLVEEWDT